MIFNEGLSIDQELWVFDDFYFQELPCFPKTYLISHQDELRPVTDSKAPGIQFPIQLSGEPGFSDHINKQLQWVNSILGRQVYLFKYYLRCQLESHKATVYSHVDACEFSLFIYLNDIPDDGLLGFRLLVHESGVYYVEIGNRDALLHLNTLVTDRSKWHTRHYVPHKMNRAILVKANLFHTGADKGFGTNVETGRLTEHFFLNSRKWIRDHLMYKPDKPK